MNNDLRETSSDPWDAKLLAAVHPADWVNPEPAPQYHLVVIGAGTAGLVTAAGAAGLGAKVALIERDRLGGDCLNFGCVPSKALLRAGRVAATVRDAGQFGVEVPEGTRINFAAVMERMRRLRASISPNDSAERFRRLGVDVFLGEASFLSPKAITVGGKTLRFHKAVIATGARAAPLSLPGVAETGYLTNETVFSLTTLPSRLAVIGAGPIGCELAQAFARFGAAVTLINSHDRILPREDADAAAIVEAALRRDGIQMLANCNVRWAGKQGDGKTIHWECREERGQLAVDEILVGVGRQPNVAGLNLEAAGVVYDVRQGVQVNDRLQTTNPHIYAAGDICSRFQFTHAADAMARIVIQNALFRGRAQVSALTIPWCTYTEPELAHVGLSEADAREANIPIQTFRQNLEAVDRAILDGEHEGFVKVHVRPGTDRILGASIVADHAGDLIAEVSLAMTAHLGLRALARTIHPYPTQAEAIKKLADAYNRTRLTPLVQWGIGRWLRYLLK